MRLRRGELARWLQAPGNRRMFRDTLQLMTGRDLSCYTDGELIEYAKQELDDIKV